MFVLLQTGIDDEIIVTEDGSGRNKFRDKYTGWSIGEERRLDYKAGPALGFSCTKGLKKIHDKKI